jgi:ATP phosphoribosyltransferase regulatory subunit
VDITASGRTLRENNLQIVDEVLAATARFVANVASLRTDPRVRALAAQLQK